MVKNIKYGISTDKKNAPKMYDLLRFKTTKSEEYISLDQYIENMQEESNYYLPDYRSKY